MRNRLVIAILLLALGVSQGQAQSCDREPPCPAMRSCAEADFYFRQCGHYKRDGDNDGIPCEEICGKTLADYERRRQDSGF